MQRLIKYVALSAIAVSMMLASCSSDNKTAPIIKPQPGGGTVPSGPTSEIKVGEVLPPDFVIASP